MLTPEDAVLRLCARGTTPAALASLLPKVTDWDKLEAWLLWHRLTPLFVSAVSPISDALPPELWARLRREGAALLGGNLELVAEQQVVLETLRGAGVRVLCHKGAALAMAAYGSVALRPFADIDLLVSPKELGRALVALRGIGYEDIPDARLPISILRAWRRGMAYETALGTRRCVVDLHWGVAPPYEGFPYDFEELWARRQPVESALLPDASMSGGEELVAQLCFHGIKHAWEHLEWIGALSRIVDKGGITWESLLKRARTTGTERVILLGAALVEQLGNASLPRDLRLYIAADEVVQNLSRRVWSRARGIAPGAKERYLNRFAMGLQARTARANWGYGVGMAQLGAIYVGVRKPS